MSEIFLRLLNLEARILNASRPVEAAFLAVDLAHTLIPYRQAVLWSRIGGVVALSGAATIEDGSPYVLWLGQVFRALESLDTPTAITAADLPAAQAEQWAEWLPAHAVALPMGGEVLLYAREEAFGDQEIALLHHLAALVKVSRLALLPRSSLSVRLKALGTRKTKMIAAATILAALFPVTGSVLAPADAVPAHPVIVRAPLDGVVVRIAGQPNAGVPEGQARFVLDGTGLSG